MTTKRKISTTLKQFLEKATTLNNITLYRGEEKEQFNPTDNSYSFFAKDKSIAEGYGDYIWTCIFKSINLFVSYEADSVRELYDNGYKLRDEYIEFNWGEDEDIMKLYDFHPDGNMDDWGYKTPEAAISSPHFDSDTWEMIEHTPGVMDYILSKYDGVMLLEGGSLTYYIDTGKIVSCVMNKKPNKPMPWDE